MPKAPQEPSRPLTRSMASSTIRRSARLSSDKRRPSRLPSLLLASTALAVHRGTKKRKRPPVSVDVRSSESRKGCEQIRAQDGARLQHGTSRENAAPGGSSAPTVKTPVCHNRGSARVKELEKQLDVALRAKRDLTLQLDEQKASSAQFTLKYLEEYFTCPLCFEILACPYTMTPRNCGHTFCATCILKWFFSRLHRGCGGWHEAVDCPLCRSALPHTPERTPRSTASFPFTPNRTADIAIRGLINNISLVLDVTSIATHGPLSDWNEDGHSKQEWSKRERAGRTEMTSVAAQWSTLKPTDFINIKSRLEV